MRTDLITRAFVVALCLAISVAIVARADSGAAAAASASRLRLTGSRPITFERNEGQTGPEVKFLSRGRGGTVFFTEREIVFSLSKPEPEKAGRGAEFSPMREVVRMRFAGANPDPGIGGEDELSGKSNYFIGSDPSKWRRNVTNYGKVRYHELYPGIDAIFYGSEAGLEYDLVVSPGADPRKIRLAFDGIQRLGADANSNLIVYTKNGHLVQHVPHVYQEAAEGRREIASRYARHGRRQASFELGNYDRSKPVVLDPVLSWSTYLGGTQQEFIWPIAVDLAGNVYLTGGTLSTDFPTQNPIQGTYGGGTFDAFVTKIDAAGTGLVYSTYLGGTSYDWGQGITVDGSGNVFLTGETSSTDFPTVNPIQPTCGCTNLGAFDAFVAKISAAGDTIIYSTFYGGSDYEEGDGIAVDGAGSVYVAGWTGSADFPTVNPIQPTFGGGPPGTDDAFVLKINAAGTAVVYATYLGGDGEDEGLAIAVDAAGDAFVTGNSASTNFPTQNAIQPPNSGGMDAYVTEINAAGTAYVFSTLLGGSADDSSRAIAVDSGGSVYIEGNTLSSDFPTKNALQPGLAGGNDKFVTKLDPSGTHLVYSTYLGGSGDEGFGNYLFLPQTFAIDGAGDVYLAVGTSSLDLPTVNAVQSTSAGGHDGYIAILNATGTALLFATYLGGSGDDEARSVGTDAFGRPYVTGETNSNDFPTKNPIQPANAGNGDLFVARIDGPFVFSMTPAVGSAGGGTGVTISGVDLDPAATVTIGGLPALPRGSVPSDSSVGATSPTLAPGALYDVTVTNPDMNAATLFKGWFAEFADVDPADPFAPFIEKLFRNGITGGCGSGNYCPGNAVTRDQMAVFLLKGKHGSSYVPPPCAGIFPDVECLPTPAFAVNWIEELFNESITGGCGGGLYCPSNPVTRAQMAVFLLKSKHGSGYLPPACAGIFPDVECTPTPAFAVDWIEELFNEGITGGCGGGNYCPDEAVTRGQMAVFLVKTFGLQ
jgi:hypothetical protein